MKKLVAFFAVSAVVFLFAGFAAAQDWFIPGLPEGTEILIDGQGDDWAWFPEAYALTTVGVADNDGKVMPTVDDWDVVEYMAWEAPNWLYMFCSISDDQFSVTTATNGSMWQNDCHEFVFDGDMSGGNYRTLSTGGSDGETAQQYGVWIIDEPADPIRGNLGYSISSLWCEDELQWAGAPPILEAAVDPPDGEFDVTYAYEVKVAVWDALFPTEVASTPHAFSDGDQFGFTLMWDDTDARPEARDHNLHPLGGGDAWTDADKCAVFECVAAPVAVESSSWGSVKAQFK